MKRALLSKNKAKFIDGSIKALRENETLRDAWERCNVMVISWLTRSMANQIAQSILYIDNARDLWEDLREHFAKGDHFRIYDILQDIHSMKQGERCVSEFFTELKTMWEETEALRPMPVCTCDKRFNCIESIARYKEEDRVMCLLKGLNDVYNTIKTCMHL